MKRLFSFALVMLLVSIPAWTQNYKKVYYINGTSGEDKLVTPSWSSGGFTAKRMTIWATNIAAGDNVSAILTIYLKNGRTSGATQATADDSVRITLRMDGDGTSASSAGIFKYDHFGPFSGQMLITASTNVVWECVVWGW